MKNARAKRAKLLFFYCQLCKFVGFLLPSSSWLLELPSPLRLPCTILKSTKLEDCKGIMHEKKLSHWSCTNAVIKFHSFRCGALISWGIILIVKKPILFFLLLQEATDAVRAGVPERVPYTFYVKRYGVVNFLVNRDL